MSAPLTSQHLQELLHEFIQNHQGTVLARAMEENSDQTEALMIEYARRVEMTVHDTGRARASMFAKRAEASAAEALYAKKDTELARALSVERYLNQIILRQTIEWVSGTELQVWPVEGLLDPGATAHLRRQDADFFIIDPNRDNLTEQTPVTVEFKRDDPSDPSHIQFKDTDGAIWRLQRVCDAEEDTGGVDVPQTDEPETVKDADVTRAVKTNEEVESPDNDKPA